jgi:hypothetical protein
VTAGGRRGLRIGALALAVLALGSFVLWERSSKSTHQAGDSCSGSPCTRVLFIGNSLTYVNDLPHTFAALAVSGHHQLFQPDGNHPTVAGTYLTAAVFYATIFGESPVGLHDHDGLSAADAATLQSTAGNVVLNYAPTWGLNRLSPAP